MKKLVLPVSSGLLLIPFILAQNAFGASPRSILGAAPVIAPAKVLVLDSKGRHVVHSAKVKKTITLSISFKIPRSFPRGYTDIRFEVDARGKPRSSIIYGRPKHPRSGQTVGVRVRIPVSSQWVGKATVIGRVNLLKRPSGFPLDYMGEGKTSLLVRR